MADYYSILKKTIASLPENNGAARRSVYSRARNAIVNQLKAYEPPLAPSEITAEQLRLEEAIRKVEAEAARESLGLNTPAAKAAPPVPPSAPVSQPAATAHVSAPENGPAATETHQAAAAAPLDEAPAVEPAAAEIPSPLQETLTDAGALGSAAGQAVQGARDVADPIAADPIVADPASGRQDPAFNTQTASDDGLFEPAPDTDTGRERRPEEGDGNRAAPETATFRNGRDKRSKPSASEALRGVGATNRIVPIAAAGVLALLLAAGAGYFFLGSNDPTADGAGQTQTAETQSVPDAQPEPVVVEPAEPEAAADEDTSKIADRLLNDGDGADVVAPDARTVTTTTITPQTEAPDPEQPSIVTTAENDRVPTAPEEAPVPVPEDNLAAISPEDSAPSDPAVVAEDSVQRSILYEEGEETGGAGTAAQGAVVWNVEEETNLDGQAQAVLSAAVEIPERDVKVEIRIKPNDDNSLPASHLVEIKYEFPESFAAGDVVNVPGLVMKPTEEARGDALIGASVKVSPGFFWIALSSLPNEQQRNLALLRERGWIDIPMLYENGKRGILTLEKGTPGSEAVEQAISAWQAG
ncbi:hypothetical protein WNZ15_10770 [Roseibium sp. AS2]|uniref:hypothetical protein n=1 Tax=Roseibium sp. AS2 TaxID=3135781 RepID=UPI00316B5079